MGYYPVAFMVRPPYHYYNKVDRKVEILPSYFFDFINLILYDFIIFGEYRVEVIKMPRNDGNKKYKEELKKIELTYKNIRKNEEFLAENAEELSPHQIKDVKKHLDAKKKFLTESDGTIRY